MERTLTQGLTIDGPFARDLDDALWAKPTETGGFTVDVSIADVARVVVPGSDADTVARRMGCSRYHARGTSPMLPTALSYTTCSLLPPGGARR